MSHETIVTPSDLGHRIARRRQELGLSREDVAARAGMAAGYVAYLEEHQTRLSVAALLRLADALETTPAVLLRPGEEERVERGADEDRLEDAAAAPVGAPPRPVLRALEPAECLRLLRPGGVGRVAITTPSGPEVLPVNYTLLDDAVIVRTDPTGPIAAHAHTDVGFEVDYVDEALRRGWSVLITGPAHPVTSARDLDRIRRGHAAPEPWPGGQRDLYLRISPNKITGRRIEML